MYDTTTRSINLELSYREVFAAILATHTIDAAAVAEHLGYNVPAGHLVAISQDRLGGEVALASEVDEEAAIEAWKAGEPGRRHCGGQGTGTSR